MASVREVPKYGVPEGPRPLIGAEAGGEMGAEMGAAVGARVGAGVGVKAVFGATEDTGRWVSVGKAFCSAAKPSKICVQLPQRTSPS